MISFMHYKYWIILSLGLLVTACGESKSRTVFDVNSLLCVPRPVPPILNTSQAICFAAYLDNVSKVLLKAQHIAGYKRWKVIAYHDQDDDFWTVQIRSTGNIFPGYRCTLIFTEKGEPKKPNIPMVQCGYNK